MGLARSTFYDTVPAPLDAAELVARIGAICDAFECYGYRRVGAAPRHQGVVVNGKKLRRLMREHGLQPKRRRRYVGTTDSDHSGPIYPDLAKDLVPDRPNQLWVARLSQPGAVLLTQARQPGPYARRLNLLEGRAVHTWRTRIGAGQRIGMQKHVLAADFVVAVQGLAPERVLYAGTISKTLAPGLRLGWLVVPAGLLECFKAEQLRWQSAHRPERAGCFHRGW